MLSGLFVCLFPGIGCRLFFVQFPAVFRGFPLFCSPRYSAVSFLLFPGIGCRLSSFCAPPCISAPVSILPDAIRPFRMSFPRHRMPAFLCSVPLPVSRHLFLFCRMLSGLFVCLFRRPLLLNYQSPITNHQLPVTNNHIMVICWLYAGHVLVICYTLLITSRGPIQVQRVP